MAPVVACVILAGGRGTRLGSHLAKPLVEIGGRSMLARVLDRVAGRCDAVLLGANDEAAFAGFGLPVIRDRREARLGPLAALEAAAGWLRDEKHPATHLLSLPGDTPFLPSDVADQMTAMAGSFPVLACCRDRIQPSVALWPLPTLDALASSLDAGFDLSIRSFASRTGFVVQDFAPSPSAPRGDPFFNVNTPADLAEARAFAGLQSR